MRWTLRLCVDERSLERTAKSCGSGAPKQALRSRRCSRVLRVTVATKRWSPRRARITRKTIVQGMPVDPALPVVTAACFFCCRRAMGEVVTRHSLRPLFSSRASSCITRADWRRGNADLYPLGSLKLEWRSSLSGQRRSLRPPSASFSVWNGGHAFRFAHPHMGPLESSILTGAWVLF
jgi:hypothetical protein